MKYNAYKGICNQRKWIEKDELWKLLPKQFRREEDASMPQFFLRGSQISRSLILERQKNRKIKNLNFVLFFFFFNSEILSLFQLCYVVEITLANFGKFGTATICTERLTHSSTLQDQFSIEKQGSWLQLSHYQTTSLY